MIRDIYNSYNEEINVFLHFKGGNYYEGFF